MNTKQTFQRVRALTGHEPKSTCTVSDPETFTRELNTFYTRLDNHNFSTECQNWLWALPLPGPAEPAPFTEEEVRCQLSCCKSGKAPGPDGILARVLKTCNQKLSPVLHSLFQESLWTATIPTLWKTSTIIPIPKRPRPTELNHYGCPDISNNEMFWENPAACHPPSGPPPIWLQGQKRHVGCHGLPAAPSVPGLTQQLCQASLCWFQFCFQRYPERPADPKTTPTHHWSTSSTTSSVTDCKRWEWAQPRPLYSPSTLELHRDVCWALSNTLSTQTTS